MQLVKKIKKHSLTLLEISVAFFLLGILLSSLWGLYQSYLTTYQKNQKTQTQIQKILFIKQRIDKLVSLVADPSPIEEEKNYVFTPSEKIEGFQTLCLSYHNSPDPEPLFSGRVRSLLYLNPNKELCLSTWAPDKQLRTEILLQKTLAFSLSYFDPQTNLWREDWPSSFGHLPVWILLKIESETLLELRFKVERSFEPILYIEKYLEIKGNPS